MSSFFFCDLFINMSFSTIRHGTGTLRCLQGRNNRRCLHGKLVLTLGRFPTTLEYCLAQVASGLPIRNGNRHASEIAQVSLHIRNDIESFVIPSLPQQKLAVRIGLHSGPAVAGGKFSIAHLLITRKWNDYLSTYVYYEQNNSNFSTAVFF